jgi:hypothetical protein
MTTVAEPWRTPTLDAPTILTQSVKPVTELRKKDDIG